MNCKNAQSLLSAYLDDELSGREMLDIREHLYGCESCSSELQSIEVVKRMLGGAPVPEPSVDFEERLVSRVLAAAAPARANKKLSAISLTGIAAASMLATMLLLNAMHRDKPAIQQQHDTTAYDLMQNDRIFSTRDDPKTASPVVFLKQ